MIILNQGTYRSLYCSEVTIEWKNNVESVFKGEVKHKAVRLDEGDTKKLYN